MQKGFTLIETLIYIALMAFILGAGVTTAYYLIDASARGKSEVNTIAEAEFLMRKIDWAMTGASDVDAVNKEVIKGGTLIKFSLSSTTAQVTVGGVTSYLTSDRVKVTGLEFILIPTDPKGVIASSTIDGKHFEVTKYIRK
jgi:type II secretory pathway pseudopilin PulG